MEEHKYGVSVGGFFSSRPSRSSLWARSALVYRVSLSAPLIQLPVGRLTSIWNAIEEKKFKKPVFIRLTFFCHALFDFNAVQISMQYNLAGFSTRVFPSTMMW